MRGGARNERPRPLHEGPIANWAGPDRQRTPGAGEGVPPYRLQIETRRSIVGLRRFVFSASEWSMDSPVGWERHSVGSVGSILSKRAAGLDLGKLCWFCSV